jgi:hypothetical protein
MIFDAVKRLVDTEFVDQTLPATSRDDPGILALFIPIFPLVP